MVPRLTLSGRVSRRGVGETVEVFDGRGRCVVSEIESIEKDRVRLRAGAEVPDRSAPIELADVPARLHGPGLLEKAWVQQLARSEPEAEAETYAWRRPKVPVPDAYLLPTAPPLAVPRDARLAEVAD